MRIIHDQTGAQRSIGYVIEITGAVARVHLDIDQRHLNRRESLHGGLVTVLLDAASGYTASLSVDGETLHEVVTVSMSVNYLATADSGRVIATARKTGGGKQIVFIDSELKTEDGGLLATATGTFRLFVNR